MLNLDGYILIEKAYLAIIQQQEAWQGLYREQTNYDSSRN